MWSWEGGSKGGGREGGREGGEGDSAQRTNGRVDVMEFPVHSQEPLP